MVLPPLPNTTINPHYPIFYHRCCGSASSAGWSPSCATPRNPAGTLSAEFWKKKNHGNAHTQIATTTDDGLGVVLYYIYITFYVCLCVFVRGSGWMGGGSVWVLSGE